jgi:O-antigen ligase
MRFAPAPRIIEPMLDSRRVAAAALLLLPGGLMAYFAFNSGGFYPAPPAYVAIALCVVLLLRMLMAGDPFEGTGRALSFAAAAMALYTLLTLLSQLWSHAPGRALVEFDQALVYLLVMVLFGSVARSHRRLIWMLRALAAVIVVICTCGLITRVLPHVWPISAEIANNRLSFPVTYWNVLGLVAGLGIVLCVHFSSDEREPLGARVAAAAATPILTTTLYFTFSRGAIAATVVAAVVYVLVGRPRLLLSALVAILPTTAVALKFAYDANLLATPTPTTAPAVGQGHHVALAVGVCVVAAVLLRTILGLSLDGRLVRLSLPRHLRRRVIRTGWISLALATVIAIIALNGTLIHEYHRFTSSAAPGSAADLRTRLTDPGNDGRIPLWRVAWHEFRSAPLIGQGAGTFENSWAQHRPTADFVVNAHSLYMETLDELGIVGFVLLLAVILTVLVAAAARARGPTRPLYAAAFSLLLALALHTGVDWDWQMPVVTVVFFALGGFMLSRPLKRSAAAEPSAARVGPAPPMRTLLGLGCVLLAVAPTYVWLSQRKLNQATAAFDRGNCALATRSALSSISILGSRPEPYEVLGYCDIRDDMPQLAIATINKAISLDPDNWDYRYDLAIMQAAAGLNPRAAARKALSLDPLDPLVQAAWKKLGSATPAQWSNDGTTLARAVTNL